MNKKKRKKKKLECVTALHVSPISILKTEVLIQKLKENRKERKNCAQNIRNFNTQNFSAVTPTKATPRYTKRTKSK